MKLPHSLEQLEKLNLTRKQIIDAILERRRAIRYHRDQKGDDRCWLDDFKVWAMVLGLPDAPSPNLTLEQKMAKCTEFYRYRRTTKRRVPMPKVPMNRRAWNADLKLGKPQFSMYQLIRELHNIQISIACHHDSVHPRRYWDDQHLYYVLPERIPADFRLPPREDFLGENKAPNAGCPSFWRSHAGCTGSCRLDRWGPCKVTAMRTAA